MLISSLSSTPILILGLQFSWVWIYIGSTGLHNCRIFTWCQTIYRTMRRCERLDSVCMYVFIYLLTSLHNQTTCSHNTHSRRYAGNSDIVTTKCLLIPLNDPGFPATNWSKSYFRAMVYIILHTWIKSSGSLCHVTIHELLNLQLPEHCEDVCPKYVRDICNIYILQLVHTHTVWCSKHQTSSYGDRI